MKQGCLTMHVAHYWLVKAVQYSLIALAFKKLGREHEADYCARTAIESLAYGLAELAASA